MALAREHDSRLDKRAWTKADGVGPLRHALEVRHPSFEHRDFVELLRKHNIALVVADTAGKWPFIEDITSDFIYVRLHGDAQLYVSGYTPSALEAWTRKVRAWNKDRTPAGAKLITSRPGPRREGRDVFVYFDNDVKVRAPFDAMSLAHRLGLGPAPASATETAFISERPRPAWPPIERRWSTSTHRS